MAKHHKHGNKSNRKTQTIAEKFNRRAVVAYWLSVAELCAERGYRQDSDIILTAASTFETCDVKTFNSECTYWNNVYNTYGGIHSVELQPTLF